jgi:hypothetical protein
VDGPLLARLGLTVRRIACAHMSGLYRVIATTGQDGLRGAGSKHSVGVVRRWIPRIVPPFGSTDHTISSFPCKFRLQCRARRPDTERLVPFTAAPTPSSGGRRRLRGRARR